MTRNTEICPLSAWWNSLKRTDRRIRILPGEVLLRGRNRRIRILPGETLETEVEI
jgi:hypothetical protein